MDAKVMYEELPRRILRMIVDESPEGISVGDVKGILQSTQELVENIKFVFED